MVPTPKMMVMLEQGRAPEGDDGDDGHDAGEGEDDEGAGVEGDVGRPALVTREQPERPADEHADGHRGEADDEGYPGAEDSRPRGHDRGRRFPAGGGCWGWR